MKTNLPPDIKVIVTPLASLLALLILGYLLLSLGMTRIMAQNKEVENLKKEVSSLESKNSVLNEVTPTIAQNANLFSFALPAEDPAPMVFSQLKTLSASAGVTLNTLLSRPNIKSTTIPSTSVSVNIGGTSASIFNFLNGLNAITPLVVVNSVIIGQDKTGNVTADVVLNSFWSPFPETLPASVEPISDLTAEEKDMIGQMANYKVPVFTELTPTEPSFSRSSPFGN